MSFGSRSGVSGLLKPLNHNNNTSSYNGLTLLDGVFFKIVSQKASQVVAHCIRCLPKTVEIKGYCNTTSNFVGHLRRKHGEEAVAEYKKYLRESKRRKLEESSMNERTIKQIQQAQEVFDSDTLNKDDLQENPNGEYYNGVSNMQQLPDLDEEIINCFINSLLPLRVIEDPHFINICKRNANSQENCMNRSRIAGAINDFYVNQMQSIKDELARIGQVCTTTEIWTKHKITYLGVMVHWIDLDLNRKSVALACHQLGRINNFVSIDVLLKNILEDFDCCSKNIATIADNSVELRKAFKAFVISHKREALRLNDKYSFNEINTTNNCGSGAETNFYNQYYGLSYISQILNLCITCDVMQMLDNTENKCLSEVHRKVIEKCSILWDAASSSTSTRTIYAMLGHALMYPDASNCSSFYDSLKQVYNIKDKTVLLFTLLDVNDPLTDSEYEYIGEYLSCTEPMVEAMNVLETRETCYYGIVVPCLLALRRKLKKMQRQSFKYCSPLCSLYLQSVEKRFREYFEFSTTTAENAAVAALSYPKFKNRWFSCIGSEEISKLLNIFKAAVENELISHESVVIKLEEPAYDDKDISMENDNDFFVFNSESDDEAPKHIPSKADVMVLQFFNETSKELALLDQYIEIKRVFIKYNTTLPAPAEKIFLYESMINLPKSTILNDELIEKRIVLKINLNNERK